MNARWQSLAQRLASAPMAGAIAALLLLAIGLALAIYNERLRSADSMQRAIVQAQILAASVAAPLAFDDVATMQEFIMALRLNPEVQAAGAYDTGGYFVSGYARSGVSLPRRNAVKEPVVDGRILAVTAAVVQRDTKLGSVYLQIASESLAQRVIRYLGISVVLIATSTFLVLLGASSESLAETNRKLQEQIKEREKAEEALRQAQKMEAMGQLTGGVAHDFNNLLMAASSGLDLMERTSDAARRERLRQGIRQAIDRGANLTQQLLAFARRAPLHPQVVDLCVCIRGMLELLEHSLRENIHIELRCERDTWPVEVDPSQLQVAVLNIALNARDAMPHGGTIYIHVENVPSDNGGAERVQLTIADTGSGIAPELLTRVFEPFFTTKGIGQGTGLGLSQVYGFVRATGGEVNIDSKPGKGTTVSLLLPRSHKRVESSDRIQSTDAVDDAQHKYHVLLVEDDDTVADVVTEMLAELGHDVTRAGNAGAALNALRAHGHFDLVLSDMVMPGGMDGLDLASAVAAQWPQVRVILMTGYSAAAATAAAKGLRVLTKPYRMEALIAELDAARRESGSLPRH